MSVTPVNSTLTVTTAGTRVQVTATTSFKPSFVYFESVAGTIYLGLSNVSSTNYIAKLTAGQGFSLSTDVGGNYRAGGQGIQLSSLYIDSAGNGDKCQLTYMYAIGG